MNATLRFISLGMERPSVISIQGFIVIDGRFPNYPEKTSEKSIASLASLSDVLDVSLANLESARLLSPQERYRFKGIPKAGGGERKVYNPSFLIRLIQSRINTRIFKALIRWPGYLFGSIPNTFVGGEEVPRDYIACASKHCMSKSLLKVDISNFFDNIHRDHVFSIFSEFLKFPDSVSDYLTDICCYEDFLVQGALTSSYIATLCFWNHEGDVVKRLARKGLTYTRLVDDITVSSSKFDFNFDYAEHHIKMMLIDYDLPVNDSKKIILRDGIDPLHVHGLRVNYPSPRLPSGEVRRIRAAVHNVVKMSKVNNYRTSQSYRLMHDRCVGRVNKLKRVGHNKHSEFICQLMDVIPLPSRRDVREVEDSISYLELISKDKIGSKKNMRKLYLARYRVSIIRRIYKKEADIFDKRLLNLMSSIGS